jgi:hypothetical protein
MVSPELQREFAKRGVQLISIPEGRRAFANEVLHGPEGDASVIVAGGNWNAPERAPDSDAVGKMPLLVGARVSNGGDAVEVVRTLDPSTDLYLNDHRMDDKPVLPVAMAVELMAEVAQEGWSDLEVVGLQDLRLFKGIVLENGPKQVRIRATPGAGNGSVKQIAVEIDDPARAGQPYYRAKVELADRLPQPPRYTPAGSEVLRPFPMSVVDAYRRWLFHGRLFQGITDIEGIAERAIKGTLVSSTPNQCLESRSGGPWLIDPVVFDSGLQLFLLWARASLDKTPLPSRFQRYRRFGPLQEASLTCHVRILEQSRDPVVNIDIAFVGPDGRLLGLLENMEGTCSRSLNRLASADKRQLSA